MQKVYKKELQKVIASDFSVKKIKNVLNQYHSVDIAKALEETSKEKRLKIYKILGLEKTADIFSYFDNPKDFIDELSPDYAADLLENMTSDSAVDILNDLQSENKSELIYLMNEEAKASVKQIDSYDEEVIGSYISDNFISIPLSSSIKQATKEVIAQAGQHDNIDILYVVDENNCYVGGIFLKDLITSRENDNLNKLTKQSFPFFYDYELIDECIVKLKDYSESSVPVLNKDNHIVGVITLENLLELSDDEHIEDYSRLGGLMTEEDDDEPIRISIKKRIPWLIILLFLGLVVSGIVGIFETVIATIPAIVFFQSMILDMSGNVGTQSLAVTIRTLSDTNDKETKIKNKKNILKELKIGIINGLIIGMIGFLTVLCFLLITQREIISGSGFVFTDTLIVSLIVGVSMFIAITLSSCIGTAFPIMLNKIHIDPAVASGPFITTLNDIVSIIIYYGLTFMLFSFLI